MNKILKSAICLGLTVALVTGCKNTISNNSLNNNSKSIEAKTIEKTKGKCDVFTCMEKLDATNTVEEMNEIIGFEGELTSDEEDYKVYTWDLTDDTSITSQFFLKYNYAKISADYPNSLIKQRADFSRWDEIEAKLDSNEALTYAEFVELVGGVEGTIDQKDDSQVTYKWLDADGGYLSAYFNLETGKCSMATGRF